MLWYTEIREIHLTFAIASVLLFALRGLGRMAGAQWPMDDRLRALSVGVDVVLTIVGISLWGLLGLNPFVHTWLLAKFVLLTCYVVLGYAAFRQDRDIGALAFLGALLCVGLLVGVARSKDPFLGML
ncbi:putative membrane protein SirB2 [Inhella inkyongensis]|uniref:Putative membrane protein SirB2 n=1 Tax=Inhella inkyongensis TaxID=392593 RepID=A0A840S907_9BURK|nr:SirB2 family protein [Inhella inkyongensis]MBB5204899.1 putative membrane protein SirB2 [Inhella inkyongensis]